MCVQVYQHNVYAKGSEFHSFHKVMASLGAEYADMELASFMSISKGYMGECGYRGGYCELINVDPEVKAMLIKSISASLCSSVLAQVGTWLPLVQLHYGVHLAASCVALILLDYCVVLTCSAVIAV